MSSDGIFVIASDLKKNLQFFSASTICLILYKAFLISYSYIMPTHASTIKIMNSNVCIKKLCVSTFVYSICVLTLAAASPPPLVPNIPTVSFPFTAAAAAAVALVVVVVIVIRLLSEGAVRVHHGIHGGLGLAAAAAEGAAGIAGRRQGRPRVHRAGGQAGGIAQRHHSLAQPAAVVRELGAQLGLEEVDLPVVAVLEGGAVPAPGPELVLALVDGVDGAQADAVHEPGILAAELHLRHKYSV